ncbi:uncharacterized protein EDB93DRAFT_1256972 [Suillus bovinus]|uniref:uncharacterized protein n=1 Tax=Suillus bovinus TaxID=48563 RepID=UPI001B872386|nr:uncharacterized protein EDB93DRAFT_1256972 [Suillus bovinus]KAG2127575.1 hypothetical protein EDB93DRAFT_1256972 [Suillus bovinus]
MPVTPPYPSYQFHKWTTQSEGTLKKVKVTIQAVDGDCSLKVSGKPKCFPIAAHYQLPLRALNKKFGLYKKIIIHLRGSSHSNAVDVRNTFLSIMGYMKDVLMAFLADASASANPLESNFRSPALDYYLWLDHKADGFDDTARARLKMQWNVTFDALKNGKCEDILKLLDWHAYHKLKCNDHDFCGAIQGCGGGEDVQSLFLAVDALMDELDTPNETVGTQLPGASSGVITDVDIIDARGLISTNVCDNCRATSDQKVLETETKQHAVVQLKGDCSYSDREVQAVHRSQDQVIQTAVDHKEHAVQANEGRFYSHTDQVIQTVTDHKEHVVQVKEGGSYSHKELHAISHMQDRSIQTETAKEHSGQLGGHNSRSGNVVPTAVSPITDQCINYEYYVDFNDRASSTIDDQCSGGVSQIPAGSVKPRSPPTYDSFSVVAEDSARYSVDPPANKSRLLDSDGGLHTGTRNYDHTAPLTKSAPRGRKQEFISTTKPQKKGSRKSPSEHGRPVVFAKQQPMPRKRKAGIAPTQSRNYTIDDLVSEAEMDTQNIQPHMRSFLLDPNRDEFIATHIQTHHDELLSVATFIASLLRAGSLSNDLNPGASSLMSINLWLDYIAQECKQATEMDNGTLPPLSHCVLLELSACARKDETSLRDALQKTFWDNKRRNRLSPVLLYLCKLRKSQPGADDEYARGFKVLAQMIQNSQTKP